MGPPKALTADEERAAARARRFGSLVSESMPIRGSASPAQSPAPSPRGKEGSPMAPPSTSGAKKEDEARPRSPPLPPSRKSSPGTKRRSNSIESRTSERSRRDHRERDRGGRDDRRRDSRATTPDAKAEEKGGDKDRKKQEDLLQARHDKLAGGEERRSSSSRKEKETEKERADRKAREKEEKAAKDKDEAGGKRKRDEAVSLADLRVDSKLTTSLEELIQSRSLETDGGNENGKNRLVAMTEIGIVTGTATALGTEVPATGEVIDTTIPAIETGIDGMIRLTGVVTDATTLAAVQGGMIPGIGVLMRGIDDPRIGIELGIDVEMMRLGNFFPLVLRGMAETDRLSHHFQSPRLNRSVHRLPHPRRLQRMRRRRRRATPTQMRQGRRGQMM